jgi:hypothetical protein
MIEFKRYFRVISWDLVRDSLVVGSCLTGMGVILVMGGVNVYSNLMNSGNVMFEQQPWIPVSLSALPAIGTFSIKFLVNFIPARFTRHYQITVNGLSIVFLLCWTLFFALEFHNNSGGGIDMTSMTSLETPGTSTSSFAIQYTISQLLAELFVAATLFLAADDIAKKYFHPDTIIENPEYTFIENEYQRQSKAHSELLIKRNEKNGQLARLQAMKKAYITEITASYFNIAAQLKP